MANGLFNLKQVMQAVQQSAWVAQKPPAVEYVLVGGGGSNGNVGGGAGGFIAGFDPVPNGQTLLVTVGGGGSSGTNGTASVFGQISAAGGGYGAGNSGQPAGSGASGGGGFNNNFPGQGIAGQGNQGGSSVSTTAGGGGGGAGTVGQIGYQSANVGGNGGAGIGTLITGSLAVYAGGGSGYGSTSSGSGGVGGGGAPGANGTANTGGGGGANTAGGTSGGSGIVIVSYPDTYAAPTSTTGSPTVSTSGSGSISFNGSSQYVYAPSSYNIANFSAGQAYTFECWIYQTSSPGCSITQGGTNTFSVAITSSNAFNIGKSGVVDFITTSNNVFTNNTWVHVAISRNTSNVTRIWINGTSVGSTSSDTYAYNSANQYIGSNAGPGNYFPGYMSNVRFVKGTAVYDPTQTTITVPTAPLTAVTNTTLLLNSVSGAYLADSSTSSVILTTGASVPTWNASSPFTVTGYKNRVYTWTSSGSITF